MELFYLILSGIIEPSVSSKRSKKIALWITQCTSVVAEQFDFFYHFICTVALGGKPEPSCCCPMPRLKAKSDLTSTANITWLCGWPQFFFVKYTSHLAVMFLSLQHVQIQSNNKIRALGFNRFFCNLFYFIITVSMCEALCLSC